MRRWTFGEMRGLANKLSNVFVAQGLRPGDRVAILLSQGHETAVAHVAAYRAGLVAVPLFVLFGPDALEYRLRDSGAGVIVTDAANWPKVAEIRPDCPSYGRRSSSAVAASTERWTSRRLFASVAPLRAPRHGGRGPGDHHLHVGHHRAAQGRAARPSLSPRAFAGRPAPARLPATTRRRPLDAGRLGLDRRAVRRPLSGLAGVCRWWRTARGSSTRSARSRSWRATASATCSCRRPR